MNSKDLKEKLAAQRRWREQKTLLQKPKWWKPGFTLLSMIIVTVLILIVLEIAYEAYAIVPKNIPAIFTATDSVDKAAPVPTQALPSPAPITMQVCAENLHVRFTPNGDVRGYLKQGEQVTLAVDAQGKPITQPQDNEIWIWIASPVAGWANTKFLCKPKGE